MTWGIYDRARYLEMGPDRRYLAGRVAYKLLRVGENPTAVEIQTFEDICFTLRVANGTWRTTFRNRFEDVDALAMRLMEERFAPDAAIEVQDRAVSSALTSSQWAKRVFEAFPNARFEASDLLTELIEITPGDGGESFVTEPDGSPLQYVRPPFVVALNYRESWRNPVLRFVAARALARFRKLNGRGSALPISCVHPEAQMLARSNPNFRIQLRSVFDRTPGGCDVLRTMNILNRSYFSREQLRDGAEAVFESLRPNGIWIVGKTTEDDFSNHATIFRRKDTGWEVLGRTGSGSEMEELALAAGSPASAA